MYLRKRPNNAYIRINIKAQLVTRKKLMPLHKEKAKVQHKGRLKGEMHSLDAINKAIQVCGGKRSSLARELDVSWQQINLWLKGQSIVTGERAVMIEEVTKGKVKREEVRPDLYRPIKGGEDEVGTEQ